MERGCSIKEVKRRGSDREYEEEKSKVRRKLRR